MYPTLLLQIQEFLRKNCLSLSKQAEDGRLNSAFNEHEIIERLKKEFGPKIIDSNIRDWVDFSFEEEGELFPVNIKVSEMNTADNLNCKLGIYFALTGKIPPFGNGVGWA